MTVTSTAQGKVQGVEKLGCLQFRGIPFAAPPVGELRWKSPQPPAAWDGVRDASEFGPICPQVAGTMERLGGRAGKPDPQSEDCLTLNVYTPACDDSARPVMVWIHGGAFATGSGRVPWYSGHNFARDDIVLVTINYRLNTFGFLHLGELFGEDFAGSGSLGIQDQVAALQWVQENIASFGGDPGNVTIFGESAGGMSVGTLLGAPSAKGLFHKAIPQSGASHWCLPAEVGTRLAEGFCKDVGVERGDTEALMALSTEAVLEGFNAFGTNLASGAFEIFGRDFAGAAMPSQPVYGSRFLPSLPIDVIREGCDVPVLVGTTAEEWRLFALMTPPEALRRPAVRPLRNLCEQAGKSVDDLVGTYQKNLGEPSELDLRVAIETDRNFGIPAIRLAEAQVSNSAPVWMYRFDWKSTAFDGQLGACHALEIPFVFDNLDAPGIGVFTGGEAPQALATEMHSAWVAFARHGDPGWAPYDADSRQTMIFDAKSAVVGDPDRPRREAWDGLL
jgi:para-nitrobenzyl esterase